MATIFGEVAETYDDVRPGYPASLAPMIAAYAGPSLTSVVEVAAGTGKGTALLAHLGVPITCVEPDPRMAAVLATKFPQATIMACTFEQWSPPPQGVPLLSCATAWHWLDPETRCQRAHDALAPHGTLAVVGNKHAFADPVVEEAITSAMPSHTDRPESWFHDEISTSGLFHDVRSHVAGMVLHFPTDRYLRLLETFSPFRRHDLHTQRRVRESVRHAVDGVGGTVAIDLRTTLVLARPNH